MANVDLYYDLDNPEKQFSRERGTTELVPVTNPIPNPQNITPNTNRGGGHGRGGNRRDTPNLVVVPVEPVVTEPVVTEPVERVELYYDIEDKSKQFSRPIGKYGESFQSVPNPIQNPQNVVTNTNRGVDYDASGNTRRDEVYYNLDNPNEQFSKPIGSPYEELKPVVPKSYSITLPSKDPRYESETTTYTYNADPTSVLPNINENTENPRYTWRDVRFEGKKQYIPNTYVKTLFGRKQGYVYVKEEGTINPRTYFNYKVGDAFGKLEPVSQVILNAIFYNPQTRKVNTTTPAYKILTTKVAPDYSAIAIGAFISPYMATGQQTYQSIFGTQKVISSSKQVYLSPLDVVNIPKTTANLAASEYRILGKEFAKSGKDTIVKQTTIKNVPGAESLTVSVSRLTPTGADRLAVFTKGITFTDVQSSGGFVFRTTQPYKFIGKVTNILPVGETTALEGWGQGFYYPLGTNNPTQTYPTKILSQLSKSGKYTNVAELQQNNLFWYDLLGKGRIYGLDVKSNSQVSNIFKVVKPSSPSNVGTVGGSSGGSATISKATNIFENVASVNAEQISGFASTGQSASTSFSILSSTQQNVIPNTLFQTSSPALLLETKTTQNQNEITQTKQLGEFIVDKKTSFKIKQIPDIIETAQTSKASKSGSSFITQQAQSQILDTQQATVSESISESIFKRPASSFINTPDTSRSWFRPRPDFKPKSVKKASIFSKVKKAFNVVTYRKGKEEVIARNLPEGLAKKAGVKEVLSSLRASFKLKPVGETTVEDIEFTIPTGFRMSKVEKGRYVQLKNKRFGARTETKEAQYFRKYKTSGRMKWF